VNAFFECRPGTGALDVGLERRRGRECAKSRDAQDVRHQDVGHRKARGCEPLTLAKDRFQLGQTHLQPVRQTIALVTRDLEVPPRHRQHLDRAQRGDYPLQRVGLTRRITRHQRFTLLGDVKQAGATLEDRDLAVLEEGDLPERLPREVRGGAVVERRAARLALLRHGLLHPSPDHERPRCAASVHG
jgi:hypothetical protein